MQCGQACPQPVDSLVQLTTDIVQCGHGYQYKHSEVVSCWYCPHMMGYSVPL